MDTAKKPRYHALDALRGLSLLLMIIHHLAVDLTMYNMVPLWLLSNPIVGILQPLFGACFVALSGASSRFSRSTARRGLKILLAAAAVTAATAGMSWFLGQEVTVFFGILHFLGVASLIYHVAQPLLDKIKIPGPLWFVLFLIASYFFPRVADVPMALGPLGLVGYGFHSADYYPLLPWIFIYFFGVWIADCVKENRFPEGFYRFRCRPLEAVSKHSLWLYLLHQPVIMGLFQLWFLITG